MTTYINIRVKIHLAPNQEVMLYLSVPDSNTVGYLTDEINRLLAAENMTGDIYYVFDEQLDNPLPEDSLLGGPLFPRNILLMYTMIENGSTLFVQARLINPTAANATTTAATAATAAIATQPNIMTILGRIYIQGTDERLNDMLLYVQDNATIGALLNYINTELARQYIEGSIYHINNEEGYVISDQTLLGGPNYPLERLVTDVGINNNSLLYMNCRITNPPNVATQLPVVDINQQFQAMDLNSFLDVYETLMNITAPTQQNPLTDVINSLSTLNTLLPVMNIPFMLFPENPNPLTMEDVVVGLDKNDLDKLRVAIYTDFEDRDGSDRDMCSVCFEKFIDSDMCRELTCKHLYHQTCIDKWLGGHITCPICREECGKGVPNL